MGVAALLVLLAAGVQVSAHRSEQRTAAGLVAAAHFVVGIDGGGGAVRAVDGSVRLDVLVENRSPEPVRLSEVTVIDTDLRWRGSAALPVGGFARVTVAGTYSCPPVPLAEVPQVRVSLVARRSARTSSVPLLEAMGLPGVLPAACR